MNLYKVRRTYYPDSYVVASCYAKAAELGEKDGTEAKTKTSQA